MSNGSVRCVLCLSGEKCCALWCDEWFWGRWWSRNILFVFIGFIGVELLYHVVLVSAVQQSESARCTHIYCLFWISFPVRSPQSHCIEFPRVYSRFSLGYLFYASDQIRSVAQLCLTLCDPMNHSTPGLPVHHKLLELTQTHVHRVSDAIHPSHPLSFPSPPAPNPSQHQSLFQWVNSSHEVAKVLEFQL